MGAGDNRCSSDNSPSLASTPNVCRNGTTTTTTTDLAHNQLELSITRHCSTGMMASTKRTQLSNGPARCDMRINDNRNLQIRHQQEVSIGSADEQLDKSPTNELLKLNNLKLHDEDDYHHQTTTTTTTTSETTTANSRQAAARRTTRTLSSFEAPAQLVRGTTKVDRLRRMLVAAGSDEQQRQQQQRAHLSWSPPTAATEEPAQRRMQQVSSSSSIQRLVEPSDSSSYADYATLHANAAAYEGRPSYHESPQANFGPTNVYSLELDAGNYASYGEYHLANQPTNLEFLELEPSDSRQLTQSSGNKILYPQQQLTNGFGGSISSSSQHFDSTNPSSYLNLDPSPTTCGAYDACDLPDSVIRLNYQQQQQVSQLGHSQSQPQFSAHDSVSTIQFGGGQQQQQHYYTGTNQHQLQQDSGHVSSLSCADSSGSFVLGSLHASQPQARDPQQQQSLDATSSMGAHLMSIGGQQHHHQQSDPGSQVSAMEPELKVCEWEGCEHTFLDMQEFVKHLEDRHVNQEPKEKNRYFCLWANCKRNEQEFNARYKLLIHMRVHSGEKPYPCNNINCRKSFSRLENLKIHQRSHTGEKPYKCIFDGCSKSFTNSSDRIKHHKTHKDPKPYSCNYNECTKRYTDPSSLRKHLRAHKRAQMPAHGGGGPAGGITFASELNQYPTSGGGGCNQLIGISSCSSNYDPAGLAFEYSTAATTAQHHQFQPTRRDPLLCTLPANRLSDHNNLSRNSSFNYSHHQQQQQQQHCQLSRSWCAGTTMRQEELAPWSQQLQISELEVPNPTAFGQPQYQAQQQYPQRQQQPTHAAVQQQQQQHGALMRSLPLGGFRVPYSRLSHAHAEWPPPAAGGASAFGRSARQQQPANFSHQCHQPEA